MPKPPPPTRARETYWRSTGAVIAGVDEVGRGAWAGPLVSAAVVLPPDCSLEGVRDSKLLLPKRREELAAAVRAQAVSCGLGVVHVSELNEQGLAWSLQQAAVRALATLGVAPSRVLLDGHHDYLAKQYQCETIVGGDATELCIAAASVVAKVHRDAHMRELDQEYPGYGFAAHKGYGTAAHRHALAARGPSPMHRLQWKPLVELVRQRAA